MGVVSDAFPLLRKVDGVIAVTRIGLARATPRRTCASSWRASRLPYSASSANAVKLGRLPETARLGCHSLLTDALPMRAPGDGMTGRWRFDPGSHPSVIGLNTTKGLCCDPVL